MAFAATTAALTACAATAVAVSEAGGWSPLDNRDLTGFVDGTENPPIGQATGMVTIPKGLAPVDQSP